MPGAGLPNTENRESGDVSTTSPDSRPSPLPPSNPKSRKKKITPPWLRALGRHEPPETITVRGATYSLEKIYKHDFFAVCSRYRRVVGDSRAADDGPTGGSDAAPEAVILKIGRRVSLFGLPMAWIGRRLAKREADFYQRLADLEVVPEYLGLWERCGMMHTYVPGHPLRKGEHVPDDFFDLLRGALAEIHGRGMAYVDLEKCENVIVTEDGRPCLIDFQIAWRWPWKIGGNWPPASWITRWLQRSDEYHTLKLQRRTRKDQLSEAQLAASYRKPAHIRYWGALTRPFQMTRRAILNRIDPKRKPGERGRVGE